MFSFYNFLNPSNMFCLAVHATSHQAHQGAHLKHQQGFQHQGHQTARHQGHQTVQTHGRHAPHTHFNSLRRLTPLFPFPTLPLTRHLHKHKQKLHRVEGHKNGKKRVAVAAKVTPSFLRLPAERMPGYQTFQLHEVIPRNFQEVTVHLLKQKMCNFFREAIL